MAPVALEILEILEAVFKHADWKTLVAAAQVNSLWAEEATNQIWRGSYCDGGRAQMTRDTPDSPPLSKLSDCSQERLDWYCKKIRYYSCRAVTFSNPGWFKLSSLLHQRAWTFATLKSLVLEIDDSELTEELIAVFLQPCLISLELYGGRYTSWFLRQIMTRAPSLQAILFRSEFDRETVDTDYFFDFVQTMTSLRHLALGGKSSGLFSENVLQHLSTRARFEQLSTLGYLDTRVIRKCSTQLDLFRNLRSLDATMEWESLELMLSRMHDLRHLNIVIFNEPNTVCADKLLATAVCTKLEDITIDMYDEQIVANSLFSSLSFSFPQLRKVAIIGEIDCPHLSDELFEVFTSNLTHLEVFQVTPNLECKLSIKTLISFARNCPGLVELRIESFKTKITDLDDQPEEVTFRALRTLSIHGLDFPLDCEEAVHETKDRVISVFDRRFPRLRRFSNIGSFNILVNELQMLVLKHLLQRPLEPEYELPPTTRLPVFRYRPVS